MSKPNEYPPGAYYTVERCVLEGQFRLRPDVDVNNTVAIAMHDACKRTGVELIVWAVMSNHYHTLLRDPEGRLGEWLEHTHMLVGRALNARHGTRRGTSLWDNRSRNFTRLQGLDRIVDRAIYILANPTKAGLVRSPWQWPGLITAWEHVARGTGPTYHRPKGFFFREDGDVSESGELVSHAPLGVDPDDFRARVEAGLRVTLGTVWSQMERQGRPFAGREAVLATDPFDAPRRRPERKAGRAVDARPTLLGSSKEETDAMIAGRKHFLAAYADALERLRRRVAGVLFPPGAFRLWRFFGAERDDYDPHTLAVITRV